MKKLLHFTGVAAILFITTTASGQRYLSEIFTTNQVITQSNIVYATNVDFMTSKLSNTALVAEDMTVLFTAQAMGEPYPAVFYNTADTITTKIKLTNLMMDIRQPDQALDPLEARPAIIFVHTGNFLPPILNGGPTGSKIDSSGVNLAKQWAKRGFVAVNANYRLGWNPISTNPDVRTGTLLNAVYRAIHDIKMCVRHLKENAAVYGIDPENIILYGHGSGGYVVNAYTTLDQIAELFLPKFIDSNTGSSYVTTALVGNIDGYGGGLNLYQNTGTSAEVAFTANAGGALGDESWLEGGEPPHVSFHCVRDPFAPFDQGTVIVPGFNYDVVDVHGSNFMIQKAVNLGNNVSFENFPSGDPYTDRARSLYGQTLEYIYPAPNNTITIASTPEGLFPFVKPINSLNVFANEGSPWDWWDETTLGVVVAAVNAATGDDYNATTIHGNSVASNPGMGPVKGLAHIDTIQGYLIPRIVAALNLPTGIESAPEKQVHLDIFPNPAIDQITVVAQGEKIDYMELFDLTGKRVLVENINSDRFILHRRNLESGVYLLNLWFDGEKSTNKVIFK